MRWWSVAIGWWCIMLLLLVATRWWWTPTTSSPWAIKPSSLGWSAGTSVRGSSAALEGRPLGQRGRCCSARRNVGPARRRSSPTYSAGASATTSPSHWHSTPTATSVTPWDKITTTSSSSASHSTWPTSIVESSLRRCTSGLDCGDRMWARPLWPRREATSTPITSTTTHRSSTETSRTSRTTPHGSTTSPHTGTTTSSTHIKSTTTSSSHIWSWRTATSTTTETTAWGSIHV
ncbi:unnamed protein product [Chilo suppressalis]|uniref:Uncharacterized protein n=1 Tax=Chilo suppressalis TaxID=168631 RepID=A0ABN8B8K1_CHISP|nr:unnamed protein product [Chilo suppressalis]